MRRAPGILVVTSVLIALSAVTGWVPGCGGTDTNSETDNPQAECSTAADCADDNPCTNDECTSGACVITPIDGDLQEQVAGDCQKAVCVAGEVSSIINESDSQDDLEDCTNDVCTNGKPVHNPKANDTPCTIGDGVGYCATGKCTIDCTTDAECPDDDNPCTVDSCDVAAAKCVYDKLDGVETPGSDPALDCMVHQCLEGIDTALIDDTELPDDDNDCTDDLCDRGVPTNLPLDLDTACGTNGDLFCDGQGTCGECNDALLHCPFLPPCEDPTCDNHVCGIVPKPAGDTSPAQVAGDCNVVTCDGAGLTQTNIDDTDLPDDGNECTQDLCVAGVSSHLDEPQLFPCTGGQCDGAGLCKVGIGQPCVVGQGQCSSGQCVDGFCCDSACASTCDVCDAASGAIADGTCTPLPGGLDGTPTCAPYLCSGVDANCGTTCAFDTDCTAGNYCNAGACVPAEVDGVACNANGHCQSDFCVDGFCCDTACSGLCDACSVALKGAGSDGVCGPVALGTDPNSECPTATCKTGMCDGASACESSPAGLACGNAPSCVGTTQVNQDTCDGAGVCFDNGVASCAPYICGASVCKTSCTNDAECSPGNFCGGGVCGPKKAGGATCTGGNECTSASCLDGVCCSTTTCPVCQACNVNGAGTCANLAAGVKDSSAPNACTATQTCNGSGACKDDNGQSCASAASCLSGLCVDGVCCNTACSGSCDACSTAAGGSINGTCTAVAAGLPGVASCAPYLCDGASASCPASCTVDANCSAGFYCSGGACTAKKAQGATCSTTTECSSGFCVDGVCCNGACGAICTACSAAKKGSGVDGTCGNIGNSDPDNECAASVCSSGLCNGFGSCEHFAFGTPCGDLASCTNSVRTLADSCNGTGSCTDYGTQSCGLYQCNGVVCGTTCATNNECIAAGYCSSSSCIPDCTLDTDCASGEFCDLTIGQCAAQKNNGSVCGGNNQCATGFCADGFCCNTSCTGFCQACSAAKKGAGSDGICGSIQNLDPDNECPTAPCMTGLCNASACGTQPFGTACNDVASCSGGIQTNADSCIGGGVCSDKGTVVCAPYGCNGTVCANSCANDTQCDAGYYCNATNACQLFCALDTDCLPSQYCDGTNRCQAKLSNGTTCGGSNQCTTNNCIDGVCCSGSCNTACKSCVLPGLVGTCTNVPATFSDNNPVCAGADACSGVGACKINGANGQACTFGNNCASTVCTGNICKGSTGQACVSGAGCTSGVCTGNLCQ